MALTDPKNTLAFHKSRSLTIPVDVSGQALGSAMTKMQSMKNKHFTDQAQPEIEALRFYYLNHMMALVGQKVGVDEPLDEYLPLVERYYSTQTLAAGRLLYYMVCITTREARHWGGDAVGLAKKFNPVAIQFLASKGGGSEGSFLQKLFNKPPQTNLGDYARAVAGCFYDKTYWGGGGFGGPAWGLVADTLVRYLDGTTSAEAMMDTAFTLAHNNGPIFNKGMVYHNYGHGFKHILDVQAAGQIPGFLNTGGAVWVNKSGELQKDLSLGTELFGEHHVFDSNQIKSGAGTSKGKKKAKKVNIGDHHAIGGFVEEAAQNVPAGQYQVDAFKSVKLLSVDEVKNAFKGMLKAEGGMHSLGSAAKATGNAAGTLGEALKAVTIDSAGVDAEEIHGFTAKLTPHSPDYAELEGKLLKLKKKKKIVFGKAGAKKGKIQ